MSNFKVRRAILLLTHLHQWVLSGEFLHLRNQVGKGVLEFRELKSCLLDLIEGHSLVYFILLLFLSRLTTQPPLMLPIPRRRDHIISNRIRRSLRFLRLPPKIYLSLMIDRARSLPLLDIRRNRPTNSQLVQMDSIHFAMFFRFLFFWVRLLNQFIHLNP